MSIHPNTELEVSKAVEQFAFIDRSYGLNLWASDESKQAWKHDLGVMRAFDDLEFIQIELLAADRSVLCNFQISFRESGNGRRTVDHAHGVELPVLDRRRIAESRIVVQRRGREDQYRRLLHMQWTPAEALPSRTGAAYDSEHTSRIAGGRQTGRFHVADDALHRLVVTRAGRRGFAFARDLTREVGEVFLHSNYARARIHFQPGMVLLGHVIQTPRGFQARNIRAA